MKVFSCTITNPTGIDSRHAGLIAKIAKNYDDTVVTITKHGTTVKTGQLMKLIGLGIKQGDTVSVTVEGGSEEATAEYAAETTGENLSAAFAAMEDAYMQARATDVKDISWRVVNILTGQDDAAMQDEQPAILVADDLTPSETVQLDKSKLLGFITRYGSSNSHTAILARTMNIPALIGVDFDRSWDGQLAVLDGYNHCVYIDPAAELLSTSAHTLPG